MDITSRSHVEALGDELARLASNLFAGEARFLQLIGEFDQLGGWADGRTRSMAHWLNWRLGIAMPAARERVRVARRLADLPRIAGAFAEGRLSYSKVRALTRVATPATEEALLGMALYATASQLELICRTWRQVQLQSAPDAADRQRQARTLSITVLDDGCVEVHARLPVDGGVMLARAMAAVADQQFHALGPANGRVDAEEEVGRRRADALVVLAESFLANGAPAQPSDLWQLQINVDSEVLQCAADGRPHSPEWSELIPDEPEPAPPDLPGDPADVPPGARVEDGPYLPGPVLRRLACDAILLAMLQAAGQPIGAGRRRRLVSNRQRRLLHQRDHGCQFPGCPNQAWTDAHHILHWIDGGPTDLANLIRLCRGHHVALHEKGWTIAMSIADRSWTFHDADGNLIPHVIALTGSTGPLPDGEGLSHWQGDPARLHFIIDALVRAEARADENVSAETPEGGPGDQDGFPVAA